MFKDFGVKKIGTFLKNYTRNEWERCEKYTRKELRIPANEWKRGQTTLGTCGKEVKLHPKRVEKM
jgi:hypothetical protein